MGAPRSPAISSKITRHGFYPAGGGRFAVDAQPQTEVALVAGQTILLARGLRLEVVEVALPPLRRRRSDIASLLEHFAAEVSQELGREIVIAQTAVENCPKR